jgi:hypothetical protein
MTKEEYFDLLKQEKKQYDLRSKQICIKYAEENNSVKVGDIIKDHIGYGKVIKMKVSFPFFEGVPCMTYQCEEYTAKLLPKKKANTRIIWQTNIVAINGEPYKYENI